MKHLLILLACVAWTSAARADYVIKDGAGNQQTIHALTGPNSTILPMTTPSDASGNALGVPGNPMLTVTPTGSAPTTFQTTCTTSATQVLAADTTKAVRTLVNESGSTVYLGSSTVTTTSGVPFPSGYSWDLSHMTGALYCIVPSGTASVGSIQY